MRIALAQKLHIHTEIVGAFAALCEQVGLPYCVYYDVGDPMDMIPYIAPNYQHRPLSQLFDDRACDWDVLILITSDEWREPHERAFMDRNKHRIISVHHDIEYLTSFNVSPYFFLLSPYVSASTWICPIYSYPNTDHLEVPNKVAMIGAVGATMPKLKDIHDIHRFLQTGNHLYHYARAPYDIAPLIGMFPHTFHGIYGLPIQPFLQEIHTISYLWLPFPPESHYSIQYFSSTIGLALNMGKIMIMPEHLQLRFGFEGVVTYKKSITEVDFTSIDRDRLKQQMAAWCQRRRSLNHRNFLGMIQNVLDGRA